MAVKKFGRVDWNNSPASLGTQTPVEGAKNAQELAKLSHLKDDVDVGELSHHHTLGFGTGQAAPGSRVKWRRLTDADVATPLGAATLVEANAVFVLGEFASVYIRLSNATWGVGTQNVNVATLAEELRPALYFHPWLGWPGGIISGLVSATTGLMSLRYAAAAGAGSSLIISGSWALAPL